MMQKMSKIINGAEPFLRLCLARCFRQRIPFILILLVTERCNLKCPYCWIRNSPDIYAKELSTDKIKDLIRQFHQLGTRYLSVLGGEPLLRQDLAEILRFARSLGMMVDVVTNGLLIHQQIEALKYCNIVGVSLAGSAEAHDKDRGAGTHQRIIRNIELLRANNIRVRFNTTITQNTFSSIRQVAELARKYDATIAIGVVVMGDGKEGNVVPDTRSLKAFWQEVRSLKEEGFPIAKSFRAIDGLIATSNDFLDGKIHDHVPAGKGLRSCNFGRYIGYCGSDGNLFPCCHPDVYGKRDFNADVQKLVAKKAWKNVVDNTSCQFCSLIVGCEINNFLSLDLSAVQEMAETYFSYLKE
ncbi:MAG: radical SAM protein [Candidatus Omnitrophota bacterium]